MSDQINVPISPGELVDKITILEIKKEFIKNNNKLKNINHEYDLLMKIYTTQISETDGISELKDKVEPTKKIMLIINSCLTIGDTLYII